MKRNVSAVVPVILPAHRCRSTTLSILNWLSGSVEKNSNARSKPSMQKLVAAGLPNDPPRWPEATAVVKNILQCYKEDAKEWERLGEWVDRIGWERFFDMTGLPFTRFHIDNWSGARYTLNHSTHIRF